VPPKKVGGAKGAQLAQRDGTFCFVTLWTRGWSVAGHLTPRPHMELNVIENEPPRAFAHTATAAPKTRRSLDRRHGAWYRCSFNEARFWSAHRHHPANRRVSVARHRTSFFARQTPIPRSPLGNCLMVKYRLIVNRGAAMRIAASYRPQCNPRRNPQSTARRANAQSSGLL